MYHNQSSQVLPSQTWQKLSKTGHIKEKTAKTGQIHFHKGKKPGKNPGKIFKTGHLPGNRVILGALTERQNMENID
jgi:uncharacterized protein (DUF952 family)